MFTVVFMAFTLMAYIIYNTDLEIFSSFVRTMETLFSAMLSKYLYLTLPPNLGKLISILIFHSDFISLLRSLMNWFEISVIELDFKSLFCERKFGRPAKKCLQKNRSGSFWSC